MAASQVQRQLEDYQQQFSRLTQQLSTAASSVEGLERQRLENKTVLAELGLISDDTAIYKRIGPCLIKQDMFEARSNVEKRIEYIEKELERLSKQAKGYEEKKAAIMQSFQQLQSRLPPAGRE